MIIGQGVFEAGGGGGGRVLAWALVDWCECGGRGSNGGWVPNGDPFRRNRRRPYPRCIRWLGPDPAPGPSVSVTCATPAVGPEGLLPVLGCFGGVIWSGPGEGRPTPPGERRFLHLLPLWSPEEARLHGQGRYVQKCTHWRKWQKWPLIAKF